MTTPTLRSSNPQDWNADQWNQVFQKGAFRGINVHRLAKANLKDGAEINFDKDKNIICIGKGKGKVEVDLNKLQKKTGFSIQRIFHLSFRSKRTKEIENKTIHFLANNVYDAVQPKASPTRREDRNSKVEQTPLITTPVTEEKMDEVTQAFRAAQSTISKWTAQEIYKNQDTARIVIDGVLQPPTSSSSESRVSEQEYEEAKRLLESEKGKRFLEEESKSKTKLADIYKNVGTARIVKK